MDGPNKAHPFFSITIGIYREIICTYEKINNQINRV